jgi:hypothetical protein
MRPEGMARAGYYPLEPEYAEACIDVLDGGSVVSYTYVIDPCAGKGEFIEAIARRSYTHRIHTVMSYAIELDTTRGATLTRRLGAMGVDQRHILVGDSFRLADQDNPWGVILLNPPYHNGNWEQIWTERWVPRVMDHGALFLVIPRSAVHRISTLITDSFVDVRVAAFPDGDTFDRVLVAGIKSDNVSLADKELSTLAFDALDRGLAPVLSIDRIPPISIRIPVYTRGPSNWSLAPIDAARAVTGHIPWNDISGPIRGSLGTVADPVRATNHPVIRPVIPLNPTYTATALAAGILDGAVLVPDHIGSGLPPIAIRCAYSRDWTVTKVRENADGEATGQEKQQVPSLVISAVDLGTGIVKELVRSVDLEWVPGTESLNGFSAGDLLHHYGAAIRETVSTRVIPAYVPGTSPVPEIPGLVSMPRTPYTQQLERIRAITVVQNSGRKGVILAGEVATGKTTIGMICAVAECIRRERSERLDRVHRILVICPPLLISQWAQKQIPVIVGPIDVVTLKKPSDVDSWMDDSTWSGDREHASRLGARISVGMLARTGAKLGPAIEGIAGDCPRCGASVGLGTAKKPDPIPGTWSIIRESGQSPADRDAWRKLVIESRLKGAWAKKVVAKRKRARIRCDAVIRQVPGKRGPNRCPFAVFTDSMHLKADPEQALETFVMAAARNEAGPTTYDMSQIVIGLVSLIEPTDRDTWIDTIYMRLVADPGEESMEVRAWIRDAFCERTTMDPVARTIWDSWRIIHGDMELETIDAIPSVGDRSGTRSYAFNAALKAVSERAVWKDIVCNEPMFTTTARSGRRVPLAKYIHQRHRNRIDYLLSDEAHEESNPDSAQSLAGQILYQLGCPWIQMTGTTNDGYPRSMHVALWRASDRYRDRFPYGGGNQFQADYGYNREVEESLDSSGEIVAYGSSSAARVRTKPLSKPAPGFAPGAITDFVLPAVVPISVDDLDIVLPPLTERVIRIKPDQDQLIEYTRLKTAARKQIRDDMRTKKRGALMGALARIPSVLDRNTTDVGNTSAGGYVVRYGEKWNREHVSGSRGLPADRILPKERALIRYVTSNLAEGRRTLITVCYTGSTDDSFNERPLAKRITDLLTDSGLNAIYLSATQVTASKRVEWIDTHVVGAGVDCLVAHPAAICTGLDNLTYFSRCVVFDGVGGRSKVAGQLRGRLRRPSDPPLTEPMEMVYMVYGDTSQEAENELLLGKLAESRAADGLDPREALRAVGAEDGERTYTQNLAERILGD